MIREALMAPSRGLDRVADCCLAKKGVIPVLNSYIAFFYDGFLVPETTARVVRNLAHPVATVIDYRKRIALRIPEMAAHPITAYRNRRDLREELEDSEPLEETSS